MFSPEYLMMTSRFGSQHNTPPFTVLVVVSGHAFHAKNHMLTSAIGFSFLDPSQNGQMQDCGR